MHGVFSATYALNAWWVNYMNLALLTISVKAFGYIDQYKVPMIVFLKKLKKPPDLILKTQLQSFALHKTL